MKSPLISADALGRLMENGTDLVILDARQTAGAFAAGHLAGSRQVDANRDLSTASEPGFDPARGGRHPLPSAGRWGETLGRWGIRPSTTVVALDDQWGANAAARAWWMLRSIGHERVAVLDGGFQAALAAGLPMSAEDPLIEEAPGYPQSGWKWPTVDRSEVDRLRDDSGWRLIDVRSAERYRGETEPIDPVAGHIPGAINLFYGENMEGAVFKPAEALRRQYSSLLEGRPPDRAVVHCGSGVTACHTLLAMDVAGLHGASLYVGSWSEWCRRELPREPARVSS